MISSNIFLNIVENFIYLKKNNINFVGNHFDRIVGRVGIESDRKAVNVV